MVVLVVGGDHRRYQQAVRFTNTSANSSRVHPTFPCPQQPPKQTPPQFTIPSRSLMQRSRMEGGVSESGSAPAPGRGFRPLHQGIFPVPVREGLAAWSPLLDLVAIASTGENVYLYRMNGQRVWVVTHRLGSKVTVEKLRWRPDGI